VLFDVWLVARAVTGLLDRALEPAGLTADEYGVYSVLTTSDAMTPGELARWMSAPPTTVSSYVKRIEARGHLKRERNPADGRSFVLRLTPAGRAVHRRATQAFVPVLGQVLDGLGGKDATVRASLRRLHAAAESAGA